MSSNPTSEQRPRVLLVGLGPTAADAFAALHPRFAVVGLVRSGKDEVTAQATDAGALVITDTSISAIDRLLAELRPDCVIVSSYHRIIPALVLARCPFINVHYAPLPAYRGRATVNWAIINGETETAITIHRMVPGLDSGGILRQEKVPIAATDTVTDLYRKLNERQRKLLADAVADCLAGVAGDVQDEAAATYACSRTPEDGEIDWSASTEVIDRLVRALTDPYPGALTYVGTRRLWIRRGSPAPDAPVYVGRVPGRVVRVARDQGYVDVLTGDGVYRLHDLSVDNGAEVVPASAEIRSVKATLGLRPATLVDRIEALERALTEVRAQR